MNRPGQKPPTILLIDDSDALCAVLADALRTAGYTVQIAHDSGQALFQLLGEHPVDMVIADIRMPGLSGAQLYRMVKERRPQIADRFVFMTGSALAERDRTLLGDSAGRVMFKPIFRTDLLECVETFLGRPSSSHS
jgi:CheY-like chemotaxis protein